MAKIENSRNADAPVEGDVITDPSEVETEVVMEVEKTPLKGILKRITRRHVAAAAFSVLSAVAIVMITKKGGALEQEEEIDVEVDES